MRVPNRRGPAVLSLLALVGSSLVLPVVTAAPAQAFGTINYLGQRAEHEHITRAALACAPGTKSHGECFEPRSMDQLAGHSGTFGAVGAPDRYEFNDAPPHCDDADYLNVKGYPQSRAQATNNLKACVDHLRQRFTEGITAADGLLDGDGELIGKQVSLVTDCKFSAQANADSRAKCNAIAGFGEALHGVQDFYSHSNWVDQGDPSQPISVTNPPGLGLSAPSPILDLTGHGSIGSVPVDLTTGWYNNDLLGLVGIPGRGDVCKPSNTRITHKCLNKDLAAIDPRTGTATDPREPRGKVLDNEQRAVTGAIIETRHQWDVFRNALIAKYGADRGKRMILAMTQDVGVVDVILAIDTTGSMSSYINTVVSDASAVVDELSGRGPSERLSDYRVGVVDYKDVDSPPEYGCPPDGYDAIVDLPFSAKRSEILPALQAVAGKVGGGCDTPEDVLSGVQLAVGFPWRDKVNKAIIVLGDAPGHDAEPHSGLTSASVIAAANAVDPASIYPILVGSDPEATAFMTHLAEGTGGRAFNSSDGGLTQALFDALTTIVDAPPSGDTTPPTVTVDFPAPPDGQDGVFNAAQSPVVGTVTATDPSGVTGIECVDSAGGLTQGSLTDGGTDTATVTVSVSGGGGHIVECSATDGAGNAGVGPDSSPLGVVAIDGTAPAVTTCAADPATLWAPDNKMRPVTATVSFGDDGAGATDYRLVSVTSNESTDAGDIAGFDIGTPDVTGELRATRLGTGTGRVYTLTYEGSDAAGNTATCTIDVTVAHDQGN
jgi:hypothetical protein